MQAFMLFAISVMKHRKGEEKAAAVEGQEEATKQQVSAAAFGCFAQNVHKGFVVKCCRLNKPCSLRVCWGERHPRIAVQHFAQLVFHSLGAL